MESGWVLPDLEDPTTGPFWAGTQPLGWGEVDDEESVRAIPRPGERGVTFLDTPAL